MVCPPGGPVEERDVVVIGGGPAGSAVASLLAAWGHSVLILSKPGPANRGLAESLPPSTRKLLATVGVVDLVERAGFYRTTGNTVWWASREARVERFDRDGAASGFQVFRPDFDRLMLEHAVSAGAQVHRGASVQRVHAVSDSVARVDYQLDGHLQSAECRFALDCSGRTGVIARQGLRRYEPGYRMQAFMGVLDRPEGWDLPDETQTLVETYDDGWAWSVPVSATMRQAGVMVDGATTSVCRGSSFERTYRTELAKARRVGALLESASLRRVWACDASLYTADAFAAPQFLLVGDAASTLDPLSSFGVKKALASAWVAAVSVHTCLVRPERRRDALDFYEAREREVYVTTLGRSQAFSREALARHPHPFWEGRAGDPDVAPAGPQGDASALSSPEVRAACEQLKAAPTLDVRLAAGYRLEPRSLIRGREIVLEEALRLSEAPSAIRFLAGVDLLTLSRMAPHHSHVPDLFETYCRTLAPVPLESLLGALSVLVARGVLEFVPPSPPTQLFPALDDRPTPAGRPIMTSRFPTDLSLSPRVQGTEL